MKKLQILLIYCFWAIRIQAQFYPLPLDITVLSDTLFNKKDLQKSGFRRATCIEVLIKLDQGFQPDTQSVVRWKFDSLFRISEEQTMFYEKGKKRIGVCNYYYSDNQIKQVCQSGEWAVIELYSDGNRISYRKYDLSNGNWQLKELDTTIYRNHVKDKEMAMLYKHNNNPNKDIVIDTVNSYYTYDSLGRLERCVTKPPAYFKSGVYNDHGGYAYDSITYIYSYFNRKKRVEKIESKYKNPAFLKQYKTIEHIDISDELTIEMSTYGPLVENGYHIKYQNKADWVEILYDEVLKRSNRPESSLPEFITINSGNYIRIYGFSYAVK